MAEGGQQDGEELGLDLPPAIDGHQGVNDTQLGAGPVDNTTTLLLRLLTEQQHAMRIQQEENRRQQEQAMKNQEAQQRLLEGMLQSQRETMTKHGEDISRMLRLEERAAAQKVPKPTLRRLEESEDIENYLDTFERIAEQQKWPANVWATQLAGLLTGKALAAYTALSGSDTTNYKTVKTAILHRYEVNEETRRQKFRQDRKGPEESYYAWVCRVADLFDKWVKDSKMDLRELLITEQVLSQVSPEMGIWLKERKPESLEQLSRLADEYTQVRGGENGRQKGRRDTDSKKSGDGSPHQNRGYQGNQGHRNGGVSQHLHTTKGGTSGYHSQTNMRGEKRCYLCGKWGHLHPNQKGIQKETEKKAMFAGACEDVAWNEDSYKYLKQGTLNGRRVQMLVDTGADRTIVAAGVVRGVKLDSEQKVPVLCVHGDVCSYPTAYVELGADEWKKWTQVVVAPNLPVAVLLGRDVCQELIVKGLMVETRAQARRKQQESTETRTQDRVEEERYQEEELIQEEQNPVTEDEEEQTETREDLRGDDDGDTKDQADPEEEDDMNGHSQPNAYTRLNTDTHNMPTNAHTPISEDTHNMLTDAHTPISEDTYNMPTNAHTSISEDILAAPPERIKELQQRDRTLESIRRRLDETGHVEDETTNVYFYSERGLLMRSWKKKGSPPGLFELKQLVLPVECRPVVLQLAHEVYPWLDIWESRKQRIEYYSDTIGRESLRRLLSTVSRVRRARGVEERDQRERGWYQCL